MTTREHGEGTNAWSSLRFLSNFDYLCWHTETGSCELITRRSSIGIRDAFVVALAEHRRRNNSHNFSHTPRNNQERHATPGNMIPYVFRGFLNDPDQSVYVGEVLFAWPRAGPDKPAAGFGTTTAIRRMSALAVQMEAHLLLGRKRKP